MIINLTAYLLLQNGLWFASSTCKPFHSFQNINYSSSRKLEDSQNAAEFWGSSNPNCILQARKLNISF